jgi:2-oxoisovalerate dehydrogenase E1 component
MSLQAASKINFDYQTKNISKDKLVFLYKSMLKPRLIEEKMLILLRQGKISKWFSGIGQEAISVGITAVLNKEDYSLSGKEKPMALLKDVIGVFISELRNIISLV